MNPSFSLKKSSFINNFKVINVSKYNVLKVNKKVINILEVSSINLAINN